MTDFNNILQTLLLSPENEVVEFKEAKNSFAKPTCAELTLRGSYSAWLTRHAR